MRTAGALGIFVASLLAAHPGWAKDFHFAEVDGLLDVSLGYGVLVRTSGRDEDLVGVANGGNARSVNFDDGNLNYDTGIARNTLAGSAELTLRWRNFGAFARAIGHYDFENELDDRERTALRPDGRDIVGSDVEAREYYLSGRFNWAGAPVQLRVGNQTINWGESSFLRFGVDVVSPVDFVVLARPVRADRDLLLPRGTVWGAVNLIETLAVEAFYQYDWNETPIAPVGGFVSIGDAYGGDGTGSLFLGGGAFSDLGTDLDRVFELPSGTLGFDRDFMRVRGAGRDTPSNQGQWGVSLQGLLMDLNATRVGLHFINYHSPFALVNGITAAPAAVAQTSQLAINARAAPLVPIYEATGLSPAEALAAAQNTSTQLAISGLANESSYVATFPEDIKMLGMTFSTTTIRTGTLIAGEVSHHFDTPIQVWRPDVMRAALSPFLADPSFGQGPLGAFGPNQTVKGYVELDKTQVALNIGQLLGPRLGASQALISVDVGWIHIHDVPGRSALRLDAPGVTGVDDRSVPTEDSVGYRVLAQLRYTSVLGGLTITPRVFFTHDVEGVTPGPFSAFVEDRIAVTAGLEVQALNQWTASLSYTNFTGAGRFNLLRDRDAFRFNLTWFY